MATKFSKLLGGDPAEFTPAQAGAAFSGEVSRLVREDGLDLNAAWKKAKLMHPETHARLCEGANPTTAIANERQPVIPLASKALILPQFKLPAATSDEIFKAAYAANGYQSMRVDLQKVFMALVSYTMQTQKVPSASARSMVIEAYPDLAKAAGQT